MLMLPWHIFDDIWMPCLQEFSALVAVSIPDARTVWPLVLTPHPLQPASGTDGLGEAASASASASGDGAAASNSASAPAAVHMVSFTSAVITLQPEDVPGASQAWVLDAHGTALQRVNYPEEQWGHLADSLANLDADADSAEGRASLLRASQLVR